MAKAHDLSGLRFGRLAVEFRASGAYEKPHWICACDCGAFPVVSAANLKNGSTTSCGCYRDQKLAEQTRTHGGTGTPEYNSWHNMLERCYRTDHPHYANYGGRGIAVCPEWHDFATFRRDMGERPEGTTLDRERNEEGYKPDNCRWATRSEQARNRRPRKCKMYLHNGRLLTVPQIAAQIGTYPAAVYARLRQGWTVNRILATKVHSHDRRTGPTHSGEA